MDAAAVSIQGGITMNDDLISREAAIRWVKTECNPYGKPTLDFESGKKVIEHLEQMPSAQPEIIRCKDCVHYEIWQLKSDYTDDKRYKPSVCVVGRYAVHRSEDWYCADAERSE